MLRDIETYKYVIKRLKREGHPIMISFDFIATLVDAMTMAEGDTLYEHNKSVYTTTQYENSILIWEEVNE